MILNGYDMLASVSVYAVYNRSKGGRLTASGRSGYKDKPLVIAAKSFIYSGQTEILRFWDNGHDYTRRYTVVIALFVDIYVEAGARLSSVREVRLADFLKLLKFFWRRNLLNEKLGYFVSHDRVAYRRQMTVRPRHRRRRDCNVKVGAFSFSRYIRS